MNYTLLPYFATTYGEGNYGDQTYACASGVTNCSTVQGASTSTSLVNTGILVSGFVTVACLIIFVALATRIWKRKKKPSKNQPITPTEPPAATMPPQQPPHDTQA